MDNLTPTINKFFNDTSNDIPIIYDIQTLKGRFMLKESIKA
jgi:hypothetical protein